MSERRPIYPGLRKTCGQPPPSCHERSWPPRLASAALLDDAHHEDGAEGRAKRIDRVLDQPGDLMPGGGVLGIEARRRRRRMRVIDRHRLGYRIERHGRTLPPQPP